MKLALVIKELSCALDKMIEKPEKIAKKLDEMNEKVNDMTDYAREKKITKRSKKDISLLSSFIL